MSEAQKERETRSIDMTVEIEAPGEAVWEAISNAEGLMRWFPPHAEVEPGVGGSVTISWGEGAEGTAPITVWEEGKRLQWVEGPPGAVQPAVDFVIESTAGGKTVLRLVHSGFDAGADWDEYYDAVTAGWTYFLWNLQVYLEKRKIDIEMASCRNNPLISNYRKFATCYISG